MAAGHVYHWKHGWIPLTHFAALQKAHGSREGAIRYLHASAGVHGSHSVGEYTSQGVHWGAAAQATKGVLHRKGLKVGSTVYWHHPGTGQQAQVKIVGIEHTGHVIVEHSGNRNALIGHTTYSKEPFKGVPFAPKGHAVRNPGTHTKPVEFGPDGKPTVIGTRKAAPRKAAPKASVQHTGTTETAPRIDAKPDLTPKAAKHAPLPNEFTPIDPRHAFTQYHAISSMAQVRAGSQIRQAFQLGPHKVLIQSPLNKEQTQGLLHDIKETLHQAHPTLGDHGVTFLVPTGNSHFRTSRKGDVLGFVVRGGSTVHINPKVASGKYQAGNYGFMPAAKGASTRRYVITHELGHVVDNMNHTNRTDGHGMLHPGRSHFNDSRRELSPYGASKIQEGYAEAFAQHQLGGAHHGRAHQIAQEYARIYGWKKAK